MKQRGGTPHITIEVIWSNVQTRVGTPHKVLEHVEEPGGWVDGLVAKPMCRLSNEILDPTLALIRAQHGFRIQVRAECGRTGEDRKNNWTHQISLKKGRRLINEQTQHGQISSGRIHFVKVSFRTLIFIEVECLEKFLINQ